MTDSARRKPEDAKQESRQSALNHVLEEARMLLPGIQALFGFQLIAVFSEGFQSRISEVDRIAHYVAIMLVATCVILLLSPAAYHRQCEPEEVSHGFLRWAGRALAVTMAPLGLALSLELEVVGTAIVHSHELPVALAIAMGMGWLGMWFILPWVKWSSTPMALH